MKAKTALPDLFEGMNKTEKAWAIQQEAYRRSGEIFSWAFGKVTLKLADDTRYTPDFMVIESDGSIRFDEVKGFWRDDAKVKIKVAAEQFPFRFRSVQLSKELGKDFWRIREF
jgi:hypothetical protein